MTTLWLYASKFVLSNKICLASKFVLQDTNLWDFFLQLCNEQLRYMYTLEAEGYMFEC